MGRGMWGFEMYLESIVTYVRGVFVMELHIICVGKSALIARFIRNIGKERGFSVLIYVEVTAASAGR